MRAAVRTRTVIALDCWPAVVVVAALTMVTVAAALAVIVSVCLPTTLGLAESAAVRVGVPTVVSSYRKEACPAPLVTT